MDIREFDGEELIASADLGDNILAVLADAGKQRVIRRVAERLVPVPQPVQDEARQAFLILSKLRGLKKGVRGGVPDDRYQRIAPRR